VKKLPDFDVLTVELNKFELPNKDLFGNENKLLLALLSKILVELDLFLLNTKPS
jgi:hypothetical protein